MRWFKHMTASVDDEKLSTLMDEYGLEGYGFWWRIVEIVGALVDESAQTSAKYSPKKWGSLLRLSPRKFQTLAEFCANLGLFSIEISEKHICINMPNILKFRDEWTRKQSKNSGVTPEPLRKQIQNTDTEKKESSLRSDSCPEPGEPAAGLQASPPEKIQPENLPALEAAIALPLNTGAEHPVTTGEIEQWAGLYPAVDIMQELRNMRGWLLGNPTKRKTKTGIGRFVQAWLAKAQDGAGSARGYPGAGPPGRPIATTQFQKDRQSAENIAKLYLTLKGQDEQQERTNGNESNDSAGNIIDVPCLSAAHG